METNNERVQEQFEDFRRSRGRLQQRRVSIEMEKSSVRRTSKTHPTTGICGTPTRNVKKKRQAQVKTVRFARTTRRIRYAPVGPESKVLERFARHASSKISFVLPKCGKKFGHNEMGSRADSWADTDTFTDPTRFQSELNIRANVHRNVQEVQALRLFWYVFSSFFFAFFPIDILLRYTVWDKGISAIYLANKNILTR